MKALPKAHSTMQQNQITMVTLKLNDESTFFSLAWIPFFGIHDFENYTHVPA